MSEVLTRAAAFSPTTYNASERTVEVTFASNSVVGGVQLNLTPENVRTAIGAPVMDSHDRSSIDKVLGVVTDAWIVGNEARARIKFSSRAEPYLEDIQNGIISGVSIGFAMLETSERMDGKKRVIVADKWAAREISLVPVGQDPAGRIRSQETNMSEEQTVAGTEENRTEQTVINRAELNKEIRSIGTVTGLGQTWIDAQLDSDATVEQARAAAIEALKTRAPTIRVAQSPTLDDPLIRRAAIGEAITCRMTRGTPSDQARQFMNLSPVETAKACLQLRGLDTSGSVTSVIERAMTSSDLPFLLQSAGNMTMRQAYEAVPSALKPLARQRTASDFRTAHRIQLSSAPLPLPVGESGEYRYGAIADSEETWRLATFGRIVSLSRQMLVNDLLGGLSDLSFRMGQAAAAHEAQMLVDLLESNPTMSDGHAVFDNTNHHNNAVAGVISDTTLSAARLAMRRQVEPAGQLVNVTPKYLVVPSELETTAQKYLASIQPTVATDVNPFAGALTLIVEPRLASATKWYVAADPMTVEGIEMATLEGESGPQMLTENGFDVDGTKFRIRHDLAVAFVEFRSWFRNG